MSNQNTQSISEHSCPGLEVKNLECTRQDMILFQDIDFSLDDGDILQIDGVNGSGKTSLIRILAGLIKATAGEVYWQGQVISDCRYEYQEVISYIGHLNAVKSGLTALENLRVARDLACLKNNIDFSEILKRIGLAGMEDVYVNSMSAGQKRRLSLSRLLIEKKKLWLLDEPFTSLDVEGKIIIEEMIREHSHTGGITVFATHQPLEMQDCKLDRIHLN